MWLIENYTIPEELYTLKRNLIADQHIYVRFENLTLDEIADANDMGI